MPSLRAVAATLGLVAAAAGCDKPPVSRPGEVCGPPTPAPASPQAGFFVYGHSHNDYEQPHPLDDALAARFYSVEADIWLVHGEILVGHSTDGLKGRLTDLYLDPLQARVSASGSVYGDGVPFSLWICFKDGAPELRAALNDLLNRYPMLTIFSARSVTPGAVTVILTGEASQKEAFVAEYAERRACRDSNDFRPDDPPADDRWRYYALDWSVYLDWDGHGAPPREVTDRLACVVNNAHGLGREVRLFATPDTPEYWNLALDFGVRFVNTDALAPLSAFLAARR